MIAKIFFNKYSSNSISVIFITLLFNLIGFFNHKLIIQNFGSSSFEIYSLLISLVGIISNFFMIGTRSTFLKLRSDKLQLGNFLFFSSFVVLFLSVISGFLLKYILIKFSLIPFGGYGIELQIYIILQAIVFMLSYFFNSVNKTLLSRFIVLSPTLSLFLILFLNFEINIIQLILYSFLSPVIIFLPFFIKEIKSSISLKGLNARIFRDEIFYALKQMFSNVIDALSTKMNIIFLIFIISNLHEMVIYSIALSISKISSIFLSSINHVYSPIIADSIFSKENHFKNPLNTMRYFSILVSSFILLSFIIFGQYIVIFFYSNIYQEAYIVSIILLIGQLFNAYFNPNIILLKFSGYAHKMAFFKLIMSLIFLLINLFFYQFFGLKALAISYIFFMNILFNLMTLKIFKIS